MLGGKEIVQITTLDERWYETKSGAFKPSSTWIASYYPKGINFYKWLAEKGWDEAEAIKREAGERGSKVHQVIEALIKGAKIRMDDKVTNPNTLQSEELTPDEWDAVWSFVRWYEGKLANPTFKIIANEVAVEGENYCGTLDLLYSENGENVILDVKTSAHIWKEHELQISSYKHAVEMATKKKIARLEILQVGYKRNKDGFKLTEIADKYDLFQHAYAIWEEENKDVQPKQKDYPMELSLPKKTKVAKKPTTKKVIKKSKK